jgi:phytoene dehydrogenase-like protein
LNVVLEADYDYWSQLSQDRAAYQTEKRATIDAAIAALETRFPGLAADVEVSDIATPMTWVWSDGLWRAAFEGWLPTRAAMGRTFFKGGMRTTLPGLQNFHMVGQWVVPGGGLPGVTPAARALVQRLCKQDDRPFVTQRATHPPAALLPTWPATPQSLAA